jgi:hypothetical protein
MTEDLEAAQARLARAATQMPMHPVAGAISAYVNSTLASARMDALTELWLTQPEGDKQEALNAALIKHLNRRAEQLEGEATETKQRVALAGTSDVNGAVRRILAN